MLRILFAIFVFVGCDTPPALDSGLPQPAAGAHQLASWQNKQPRWARMPDSHSALTDQCSPNPCPSVGTHSVEWGDGCNGSMTVWGCSCVNNAQAVAAGVQPGCWCYGPTTVTGMEPGCDPSVPSPFPGTGGGAGTG